MDMPLTRGEPVAEAGGLLVMKSALDLQDPPPPPN